jgi:transposase
MSRKIKYDTDFRKSVVEKIIKGKQSCGQVANELGLDKSMIERWVSFYRNHGVMGIQPIKNTYTASFKVEVIQEMYQKHLSLRETCAYFKIPSVGTLMKWLKIYESEGILGLQADNRGKYNRMPKKSNKVLTKEEQLLEELASLKAENAYLKKLYALIQADKEKEEKRSSSRN